MTYFCFIESSILSVPHMEPLVADDLDEAKLEAEALLGQHASGYAAHIVKDERRLTSIRRARAPKAAPLENGPAPSSL
ncbi:hypothetical protein [Brevundimonas sp.]|uniref:hypothetical protein n=1 Tax=Brevundimonas sp. TaxID=1871086 RepID=UPI0025BD1B18|nr:hypothetical protein [Brevundimonas sp.]